MPLRAIEFRTVNIVGGLALFFGILFVGVKGSVSDIAEHHRILEAFDVLSGAIHATNENILRAKAQLDRNYDFLTKNVHDLEKSCDTLKSNFLVAPDFFQKLEKVDDLLRRYCDAIQIKIAAIETFKASNSILRNSVTYLPLLTEQSRDFRFAYGSRDILAMLLIYVEGADAATARKVSLKLAHLKNSVGDSRKAIALVENLELHTNIVLRIGRQRKDNETLALADDALKFLDQLMRLYVAEHGRQEAAKRLYYFGLWAICIGLAIWLVYLFANLQKKSAIIANMNRSLEEKVQIRTAELSAALVEIRDKQVMLIQSTKMSALGEMAGGIAHEINTPLGAILLNAEILEEMAGNIRQEAMQKQLRTIVNITQRISKIISGLRRFCRDTSDDEMYSVAVRKIVDDTLSMCAEKFKIHEVDLRVVIAQESMGVRCVPEQIGQVLLNLLNNAFDAVNTSSLTDPKWVRIEAKEVNDAVHIEVIDAGRGVSQEIQKKLMQPFFTTKEVGKGTGLGLSISKGIIESHEGSLSYGITSDGHTKFTIILPCLRGAMRAA